MTLISKQGPECYLFFFASLTAFNPEPLPISCSINICLVNWKDSKFWRNLTQALLYFMFYWSFLVFQRPSIEKTILPLVQFGSCSHFGWAMGLRIHIDHAEVSGPSLKPPGIPRVLPLGPWAHAHSASVCLHLLRSLLSVCVCSDSSLRLWPFLKSERQI